MVCQTLPSVRSDLYTTDSIVAKVVAVVVVVAVVLAAVADNYRIESLPDKRGQFFCKLSPRLWWA